ncbi:ribonuclease H-like domain-containing protein (plasmid) [Deinococcus taeanensis]|uniref:ribonuclease H-like domain-containing protein n=1 Tax=Deinococcus taeanensis TaxID=2737050 RepID=UPI001CDC48F6|nr:ribonuclease H-like domain-containing protein [Deinococcus taeanensis]UBV45109.1 ribonuclease H-like domain-containing protein [Deinococcus taeanensis]
MHLPPAELTAGAASRPGIVSVHAGADGSVNVWRRDPQTAALFMDTTRQRGWVYARHLSDLQHLRDQLNVTADPAPAQAPYHAQDLAPDGRIDERAYRYLLSGPSPRQLENEILRGAMMSRSLSVRPSLGDLSGYVRLGYVEQYLISTGQTYHQNLTFDDPVRLQFDLETTSLSPDEGRIFLIAVRDNRGLETLLEARQAAREGEMIEAFLQLVQDRDPDVIENHFIHGFDLPFITARARKLGIPFRLGRAGDGLPWTVDDGSRTPLWACPGREVLDTLDAVRRLHLPSSGLKAVARHYGIAPEDRVYLEGAEIVSTYRDHPKLVRQYALQDVQEVDALARIVLAPSFALARLTPRPYHRLTHAGPAKGVLEPMLIRAYYEAARPFPASEKGHPEPHRGGHVQLHAEGVLNHVVKADVASMYPSIIRAEGIGPRQDELGIFNRIVSDLTTQRLEHKRQARNEALSEAERREHHAMQDAMKLIVNAAYGYLGAGRLARMGDRGAADQVTARGRALLQQVTAALEARGVQLIESDTDGVYFSTREPIGEQAERGLIAAVSATLPDSITLEFDGRARAMLSHQVKNYVLLRYDGTLDVSGASFESSRSERYGTSFLRTALNALLRGDVPAVQAAFLEVMGQLSSRACTNADVSTRVRLGKTREAYAQTREKRKEAHLEAAWQTGLPFRVGDRLDLYVREGQGLTVMTDPDGHDYDVKHYQAALVQNYATRLRKALDPADWDQLFGCRGPGLFDRPVQDMQVGWRPVADQERSGAP